MHLFEKCYTLFVQLLCGFIVARFFGLCIELFEGGDAINLSGDNRTLKVKGKKDISVYRGRMVDEDTGETVRSSGRRSFCKRCGFAAVPTNKGATFK